MLDAGYKGGCGVPAAAVKRWQMLDARGWMSDSGDLSDLSDWWNVRP